MSFELVLTSVPKGLKPGSRGFSTVAFTEGMPANYVQFCESLSGYSHVFTPTDPNYSRNPVSFSHYRVRVGGQSFSILSRVAAYGTDYSGRTNKLAHHVMVPPDEFTAEGPTSAMMSAEFFMSEWTDEPHLIRQRKAVAAGASRSRRAEAWARMTGESGWAGMLAKRFLDDSSKPTFIVFEPGANLLPLVDDVVALLPAERRWDFTFNTYFVTLPQGGECFLRCCLPESQALVASRRISAALALDLRKPLPGFDESGELIDAARTGSDPAPVIIRRPLPDPKVTTDGVRRAPPLRPTVQLPTPRVRADYGKALRPLPVRRPRFVVPLAAAAIVLMAAAGSLYLLRDRFGAAPSPLDSRGAAQVSATDSGQSDRPDTGHDAADGIDPVRSKVGSPTEPVATVPPATSDSTDSGLLAPSDIAAPKTQRAEPAPSLAGERDDASTAGPSLKEDREKPPDGTAASMPAAVPCPQQMVLRLFSPECLSREDKFPWKGSIPGIDVSRGEVSLTAQSHHPDARLKISRNDRGFEISEKPGSREPRPFPLCSASFQNGQMQLQMSDRDRAWRSLRALCLRSGASNDYCIWFVPDYSLMRKCSTNSEGKTVFLVIASHDLEPASEGPLALAAQSVHDVSAVGIYGKTSVAMRVDSGMNYAPCFTGLVLSVENREIEDIQANLRSEFEKISQGRSALSNSLARLRAASGNKKGGEEERKRECLKALEEALALFLESGSNTNCLHAERAAVEKRISDSRSKKDQPPVNTALLNAGMQLVSKAVQELSTRAKQTAQRQKALESFPSDPDSVILRMRDQFGSNRTFVLREWRR